MVLLRFYSVLLWFYYAQNWNSFLLFRSAELSINSLKLGIHFGFQTSSQWKRLALALKSKYLCCISRLVLIFVDVHIHCLSSELLAQNKHSEFFCVTY